ncbi:MAG: KpsF/GutQ family sugar-phosphate isomerase [Candidatus Omnitrophota bacterium]
MVIKRAKEMMRFEIKAIESLLKRLDRNFSKAVDMIYSCKGRVVVTGMGKPGIIAQKISATLSSTGIPSLFLHPAEAAHGDLGRVTRDDVVIALSDSGETEEIVRLIPLLKKIGTKIIVISGNPKSTLVKYSDCSLDVSVKRRKGVLGIIPSAATTAMLVMGDVLALILAEKRGLRIEQFAFYHPGGTIGKKIFLKVEDIMRKGRTHAIVEENKKVKDVLLTITRSRAGSATVVDKKGKLKGIFTDGDLRRKIEEDPKLLSRKVKDVMTKKPMCLKKGSLAVEALRILQGKKIDEAPVIDERNRPIGLVDVQDLLKAGLV